MAAPLGHAWGSLRQPLAGQSHASVEGPAKSLFFRGLTEDFLIFFVFFNGARFGDEIVQRTLSFWRVFTFGNTI